MRPSMAAPSLFHLSPQRRKARNPQHPKNNTMETITPTTLYCREGGSDKVYQTAIEPATNGYIVTFAYGRRGTTLQTGTKTGKPVSLEEAQKIHAKLVLSKLKKGYTQTQDGTPYESTGCEGRDTGIRCQLLNPVEESELPRLLGDHRHVLQEKFDGRRMLVRKQGDEVIGINRRGLEVALPESIATAARRLPNDCVIDGEAVGDVLHVFDLLEIQGQDVGELGYLTRFADLRRLLEEENAIQVIVTATTPGAKRSLYDTMQQRGAEGVVFKDRESPYRPGRPASGGPHLKFKFVTSASFIVAGVNPRRSIALALMDKSKQVAAGNVTIPQNHRIPEVGEVCEVRYLYAFPESGRIYQPVYLGERDDIPATDCTTDQLKYKTTAA